MSKHLHIEIMTTSKKVFERTISPELFEAWKQYRRKGDPKTLAELVGRSRPVIDKALKYGFVKDQQVVEAISAFYRERKEAEAKQTKSLIK